MVSIDCEHPAANRSITRKAHAVSLLDIDPCQGATYWTPGGEVAREQINAFMRSGNSGCDAFIDQDLATHDPQHPVRYLPAYDAGDHLIPTMQVCKRSPTRLDSASFQRQSGMAQCDDHNGKT
jgi:hypothetical protein